MELLVVHAAATWFMVGLIWVVQAVHYPLFAAVGGGQFAQYEAGHTRRIGILLVLPALAEIVTAALLLWSRPQAVPVALVVAAGAMLAAVWIVTALVHAPLHGRLAAGKNERLLRRLVATNWARTALWSLRGGAAAAMLVLAG